jgi:hypothetical protein
MTKSGLILLASLLGALAGVDLGTFRAPDSRASSAGTLPAPKPTKAEVKAKVSAAQIALETGTDLDFQKTVMDFKTLGPPPRLQELLAELYPESNHKEKVVLLHLLEKVGVEHAVQALPAIAADYAVARPKHPNDMSFSGFYVLEKFMRLAWKKLPAEKDLEKKADVPEGKKPPKQVIPEDKPTKVAADGFTHTGSVADRKAIRQIVLTKKLYFWQGKKDKVHPVPTAENTDWVRVIGNNAFVRLRGETRGSDYLFVKEKGQWLFQAELGHWVN